MSDKVAFVFDRPESCESCRLLNRCFYPNYEGCGLRKLESETVTHIIDPFARGEGIMQYVEREIYLNMGMNLSHALKIEESFIPLSYVPTMDLGTMSVNDLRSTQLDLKLTYLGQRVHDQN